VISKKQAEFLFLIFFAEREPNAVKTISSQKNTYLIFRTLKKYSSRDTIPLRKLGKDSSHKDRSQ
jgi:hypothetical protein